MLYIMSHNLKGIIPLFSAVSLILISIVVISFKDYVLSYQHYFGILLVIISIILFLKKKKVYIYVFGFTLLLGTLNLIDIFYLKVTFGVGFFNLNPIFLALLLILFTSHKEELKQLFPKREFNSKDLAKQEKRKKYLIEMYEQKFISKTETELKIIVNDTSKYVVEAKIASENILRTKYL